LNFYATEAESGLLGKRKIIEHALFTQKSEKSPWLQKES
jgi:hypothetical protein